MSSLGGFVLEVPVFVATTKGLSLMMNRKIETGADAWSEEMRGAALVLGALKLSGWGSHATLQRFYGTRGAPILTQKIANQMGMMGGISAGHFLEAQWRGKNSGKGWELFYQSLSTLVQFNFAGALLPLVAPGLHRHAIQYSQPSQCRILWTPTRPWIHPNGQLAWQGAGMGSPIAAMSQSKDSKFLQPLLLSHATGKATPSGRRMGQPDWVELAREASQGVEQAQKGEIPLAEANRKISTLFKEFFGAHPNVEFEDPELNLITKILFGKSFSRHALEYRFGTRNVSVEARATYSFAELGFCIRLLHHGKLLGQFNVYPRLKEVILNGRRQVGWVAVRDGLHLPEEYKWKGYWTLMTFQLAEWARTGKFIAIESPATWDGGRASLADVFDATHPQTLLTMRMGFLEYAQEKYEKFPDHWGPALSNLRHPWQIMDLRGPEGEPIGENFMKVFREDWTGILPLKNLTSPQWHRLLDRAFRIKKLWELDDRFPLPAKTRGGEIETDWGLLTYFLEVATGRYLDSLDRMESHLEKYRYDQQDHSWEKIWTRHYLERIAPIQKLFEIFREEIRSIPKAVEEGLDPLNAFEILEAHQGHLTDYKATIRQISANLHLDYMISQWSRVAENFYQEFGSTLKTHEKIAKLKQKTQDFYEDSPTLSARIQFLSNVEEDARDILSSMYLEVSTKLLKKAWGSREPSSLLVARFADMLQTANWYSLDKGPELLPIAEDFAVTLATLYRDSPWNFQAAGELGKRDLPWGLAAMKAKGKQNETRARGGNMLEDSLEKIRGLRLIFEDRLPLFLIRGSHFKAPLYGADGRDTEFFLVASPSWGELEGGIAFSIFPKSEIEKIRHGKGKPLSQVVITLDRHKTFQTKNIVFYSKNIRKLHPPYHFELEGLKSLAYKWALGLGLYPKEPVKLTVPDSFPKERWVPIYRAFNQMTFSSANRLKSVIENSSPDSTLAVMEEYNPFKVDESPWPRPVMTRQD